jgi:hypothetical protein
MPNAHEHDAIFRETVRFSTPRARVRVRIPSVARSGGAR